MIDSNQLLAASNILKPTWKDCAVWIDANDYAVGTFANGATITNKGNNGATFVVVGTTLEVQLDGSGKKEFEFNGSFIRCNSAKTPFTDYHNYNSGINYQIYVIGKFGTTSNPDAIYGVCGNSAGGSANIGIAMWLDNRTSTSAALRGVTKITTKGSSGNPVFNSRFLNGSYNVEQSLWITTLSTLIDQEWLTKDGDIVEIQDVVRTTATTTSGLGTAQTPVATASTYDFEIGAVGNGTFALAAGSTIKQFVIFDQVLSSFDIRSVDAYFGLYPTRGNTTIRGGGETHQAIVDQYILGGTFANNTDRTKTTLISSRGADHFAVGTDRDGVQNTSTDDAETWPAFSAVFTDATKSVMVPYGGYNTGTGTLIVVYSKWTTATGVYTDLIARRSTDGGTTWSAEIPITLPVTSPALTFWLAHDQLMICNNGDVMMPMYAFSTTALYKIYVMRSTDDGLTWAFTEVFTSGSAYTNEPSGCSLGGDNHIIWARVEVAVGSVFVYRQFISTDDGVNWTDQGVTPFGGALYAHPPMLRSFLIDGTLVVEASWVNRLTRRWHCKYALASAIVTNGISEWTSKTTYTVFQRLQGYSGGWTTGYPYIIHSRNDLNMQGAWFEETSATTTRVAYQDYNDEFKQTIKTELGI